MYTDIIFFNSSRKCTSFELQHGSRKWNTILILKKGAFHCQTEKLEYTARECEIAFFPENQFFHREVVEPISFYQIGFFVTAECPWCSALAAGILNLPHDHVQHIIEDLDLLQFIPNEEKNEIYCRILEQILLENYLYMPYDAPFNKQADPIISKAIRYINAHLSDSIQIPNIAKEVHLSNTGLIWKFRNKLHCTPSEMVHTLRMQHAKYLLLETNLPIQEIATHCGYSNQFYFSNVFRKHFHIAPGQFRIVIGRSAPAGKQDHKK